MTWTAILISVAIGLGINEYADFAPWVACRIVRRAARMIHASNPERAEIRAEEWAAVIADRPGKVFKLFTALGYWVAATPSVTARVGLRVRATSETVYWYLKLYTLSIGTCWF